MADSESEVGPRWRPPTIVLTLAAMVVRYARWLVSAVCCAGLAMGCENTANRRPPIASTSSADTKREPQARRVEPGNLCRLGEADVTFELSRIATGDVVVLKYAASYDDHEEVARKALEAGAISAEPTIFTPVGISSRRGLIERLVIGAPPVMVSRLRPHLVGGRFPATGTAKEIALSEADARDLALTIGDRVKMVFPVDVLESPLREVPAVEEVELVGVFASGEIFGGDRSAVWMGIDSVRALHPGYVQQPHRITSVAIALGATIDRATWAKKLSDELNGSSTWFRVMTHDQLQEGAKVARNDFRTLCMMAAPAPSSVQRPVVVPTTCAHRGGLADLRRRVELMHGGVGLVTKPRSVRELSDMTGLSASQIARRVATVAYVGYLFHDSMFANVEVQGTPTLKPLAEHVVSGTLEDVNARGGIAISRAYARLFGVSVGNRIQLAVRPPQLTPSDALALLETNMVDVAAIVGFEPELVNPQIGVVYVHRDYATALHRDVRAGQANNLLLWAAPGAEESLGPELALTPPAGAHVVQPLRDMVGPAEATFSMLDALCSPHSP